jgi:hypothetical protein
LLAKGLHTLEKTHKHDRLVDFGTVRHRVFLVCPLSQTNRGLPWTQHFIELPPTLSLNCPICNYHFPWAILLVC